MSEKLKRGAAICLFCVSSIVISAKAEACNQSIEQMPLLGQENWPDPMITVYMKELSADLFNREEDRFSFEYKGLTFQAIKWNDELADIENIPIRPSYPGSMAVNGISGLCEVKFDVSPLGEHENVQAACTDTGFVRAAKRAVERAKTAPIPVHGHAITVHNIVESMSFCLR